MSPIAVFAHLNTAGGAARDSIVERLAKVSLYSKENEKDVSRYAIALPRDASDTKSIYVIEQYASQAAFDAHMASKPVVDMLSFFASNPTFLEGPPEVAMTEPSSAFARSELTKPSDPFITYASIDYKEGTRDGALEGWKIVTAETEKNEPGTLAYAISKDKANSVTVKTLEVYASEKYFKEVHVPSKAVAENKAKYGDEIRTSIKHVFLKLEAGFLHKEKSESSL